MKQINHFSDSSYHGNGCCNGTGKVSLFLSCRCLLWSILPELFKNLCLSLSLLSCVWLYLVWFNLSIDTFRGSDFEEGRMSYREFVWFLLAEEDKRHMTRWELPWLGCVCLCVSPSPSFSFTLSLCHHICLPLSLLLPLSHALPLFLSHSLSLSLSPLSHPFPPNLFSILWLFPPPPPPPPLSVFLFLSVALSLSISLFLYPSLSLSVSLSIPRFLSVSLPLSLYDIPANTEPPPPPPLSPWCLQYWVLVPLHGSRWRRSCFHVWDGILPWGADEQDGDARNREAAIWGHRLPGKPLSLSWLDLSGVFFMKFNETQICWSEIQIAFYWARNLM